MKNKHTIHRALSLVSMLVIAFAIVVPTQDADAKGKRSRKKIMPENGAKHIVDSLQRAGDRIKKGGRKTREGFKKAGKKFAGAYVDVFDGENKPDYPEEEEPDIIPMDTSWCRESYNAGVRMAEKEEYAYPTIIGYLNLSRNCKENWFGPLNTNIPQADWYLKKGDLEIRERAERQRQREQEEAMQRFKDDCMDKYYDLIYEFINSYTDPEASAWAALDRLCKASVPRPEGVPFVEIRINHECDYTYQYLLQQTNGNELQAMLRLPRDCKIYFGLIREN